MGLRTIIPALRTKNVDVDVALSKMSNILNPVLKDGVRLRDTPASLTSNGERGDVAISSTCLYVCTAKNTWRRIYYEDEGSGSESPGNWETIYSLDFSAQGSQSLSSGWQYIDGKHLCVTNNSYDRGGIDIVNGQGLRIRPVSGTTYVTCPGIRLDLSRDADMPVDTWGMNPPIRCLTKFYSYTGTVTECCSAGFARWPWEGHRSSPAAMAGLAGDASPCGWIKHDSATTNGVFTSRTDLDGWKNVIVELPQGMYLMDFVIRYGQTYPCWNDAIPAAVGRRASDGTLTVIVDMSGFDTNYWGHRQYYAITAGHNGSSGTGTFVIEAVYLQAIKRAV